MNTPYIPSRYDVRSRWSVTGAKTVDRSPHEIERAVADAVTEAFDAASRVNEPRRWELALSRPLSVFDQCEIKIALVGDDEASTSTVEIEIVFDASPSRVGLITGLSTSVVGIPFGIGWRWQSVRNAKLYAHARIDSMWTALDARLASGGQAYR